MNIIIHFFTMGQVKQSNNFKKVKSPTGEILIPNTGEIINISDGALIKLSPSGLVKVSYNHYNFIDTDMTTILLKKGVTQTELGFLQVITSNLLMKYNICLQKDDTPHTSHTIAKLCQESLQSVNRKIKKLINLNILFKGEMYRYKKVYVVNPHVLKKGVEFNSELLTYFNEIKSDENL